MKIDHTDPARERVSRIATKKHKKAQKADSFCFGAFLCFFVAVLIHTLTKVVA
jgi:hypothetical protein